VNRIPRASLCITILNDEDYRILVQSEGGLEAFGVFCAMVVVGRQRLQDGKAYQAEGTDSLVFENSLDHLVSLAHLARNHLGFALEILVSVAGQTKSEPWMYLDDEGRLVIRSFFKFNTNRSGDDGWGGPRPNSGRPAKRNQDGNQDGLQHETKMKPSGCASLSLSDSLSASLSSPQTPTGGERAGLTSEDPETLSVCRWANELVTGWGPLAEGACQTYPAAWVREACSIAMEAKASRWKFVDSILGRFKSQGGPDSARAPTTPRNTIAEKLGGGTLAERKARTKAIFDDLDRRNGVA
jgi:hypothetical protein